MKTKAVEGLVYPQDLGCRAVVAVAVEEAVAASVVVVPGDLALIVDTSRIGATVAAVGRSQWVGNRSVGAIVIEKSVRDIIAVGIPSNDLPLIVDSDCPGTSKAAG